MKANVNSGQIVCCYCEESVHAYATHCPYCQKNLPKEIINTKITSLQQASLPENPFANFQQLNEEFAPKVEKPASFTDQTSCVLLSLASLLAGSFFFFFGILIKLYSSNGVFTLEWNATSWPYFVITAAIFVGVGLITLAKIEK